MIAKALQALTVNVLDPEREARFEPRPVRVSAGPWLP